MEGVAQLPGHVTENLSRFRIISLSLIVCAATRRNVKSRGGDLDLYIMDDLDILLAPRILCAI